MTEFSNSHWAKAEFSQEYIDNADIYVIERRRMLAVLRSFYRYFLGAKNRCHVLDLGCGDGIIVHELLKVDASIKATLVDGSEDMLKRAENRLKGFGDHRFLKASFQDLLHKNILDKIYDFAVSSLAIHHLATDEKTALFRTVHSRLTAGGYFLIIDVVLAPTGALEHWYLSLWREWINERKTLLGIEGDYFDDVIRRYKDCTDNQPDTLDSQLNALKAVGFREVDCYYKYGVFAVFGGCK